MKPERDREHPSQVSEQRLRRGRCLQQQARPVQRSLVNALRQCRLARQFNQLRPLVTQVMQIGVLEQPMARCFGKTLLQIPPGVRRTRDIQQKPLSRLGRTHATPL
ncbi:hypothetical protein D3C81_1620560 [compost metagenome]